MYVIYGANDGIYYVQLHFVTYSITRVFSDVYFLNKINFHRLHVDKNARVIEYMPNRNEIRMEKGAVVNRKTRNRIRPEKQFSE